MKQGARKPLSAITAAGALSGSGYGFFTGNQQRTAALTNISPMLNDIYHVIGENYGSSANMGRVRHWRTRSQLGYSFEPQVDFVLWCMGLRSTDSTGGDSCG